MLRHSWRQFPRPTSPTSRREPRSGRSWFRPRLELLEDRTAPATLDVNAAGKLTYLAGVGVNNNLQVSLAQSGGVEKYTFTDTEAITLTGMAAADGFTLSNGNMTASGGLASNITSIFINLKNGTDTLNLGPFDAAIAPLSATENAGGVGDTATVTAGGSGLTVTGPLSLNGYDTINVNNQITALNGGTGTVTLKAAVQATSSINVNAPITADGLVTLTGSGGVTLGANVTTLGAGISIPSAVTLGTSLVTLDTTNAGGSPAGSDITITGAVDGASALTLVAGTGGNVDLKGTVGATTPLNGLTVSSANNVTFENTLQSTGGVIQTTGQGTTTLDGTSGTGIGGALSITTNAITLNTATVTAAGPVSLVATAALTINAGLTETGAHDANLIGSSIAINSPVMIPASNSVFLTDTGATGVTESGTGAISAGGLGLTGGGGTPGPFQLTGNNAVQLVGGTANNAVTLVNTPALTIGNLTTNGQNFTLVNTASVTLVGNLTATGAVVSLNAAGLSENSADLITAASLELLGTGTFTLDQANKVGTLAANVTGALSFTDAQALVVGKVNATAGVNTGGNALVLTVTAGGLTLGDGVNTDNVTATTATLNVTGGVSQAALSILNATSLELLGSGTFTLTQANKVGTLAANITGAMTFNDAQALLVGKVNNTAGINTGGNALVLTVTAGGLTLGDGVNTDNVTATTATLNVTGGVTQSTKSIITATSLELLGSGTFALNQANKVGTLAANVTGALAFTDAQALQIGKVNSTSGISTGGNNLALTVSSGGLTLGDGTATENVTATGANVTLTSAGGLTQNAQSIITSAGLELLGSSAFTLTQANKVGTVAGNITGALSFTNSQALVVGKVNTAGLTTGSNPMVLTVTAGGLTLGDGVNTDNVSASTATLNVTGGVSQLVQSIITANGLELLGSGTFALNQANKVGTLAANVTGPLSFTNAQALAVGKVNNTAGINTGGNTLVLTVTTGGLTLGDGTNTDNVTATTTTLNSAGGVTQMAQCIITDTGLELLGTGTFTLTQANKVFTLAANVTGALAFTNAQDLVVGKVNATAGINTNGNTLVLIVTAGGLDLGDGINTENVTATTASLNSAGGSFQSAQSIITATSLQLLGTGIIFNLNQPNRIGTLAANVTGTLFLTNAQALVVGKVNNTAGINTGGNTLVLTVTAGGLTLGDGVNTDNVTATTASFNVTGGVSQTAHSIVTATGLELLGSGNFTLGQPNLVTTLASSVNGVLSFFDAQALTVGKVNATAGINTTGHSLNLSAANGSLTLGDGTATTENLTATGATIDLNAPGVTENANAILTASLARVQGTGTYALTQGNLVGTLAANVNGPLSFTDAQALVVGTVRGTVGITTTGHTLILNASGGGSEGGSATLTASSLLLQGGAWTLGQANTVGTLAASTTGALTFNNTQGLIVGSVGGTNGINTGNNNNVTLTTTSGLIALGDGSGTQQNLMATGAVVDLSASGVYENANAALTAGSLRLRGTGTYNLPQNNAVTTLAASITGPLVFLDTVPLTVGTVLGTVGINSNAGNQSVFNDITLTSDSLSITQLVTGTGNLTLQPVSTGRNVTLGTSAAGTFSLTTTDLGNLDNKFQQVFIGRSDSSATLDVGLPGPVPPTITFTNNTTLRAPAPGGKIVVNSKIMMAPGKTITLQGSGHTTTLNNDIVTAGAPIIIADSVVLGTPALITLDTTNGGTVTTGANILITGTVDDDANPSSLTLLPGTIGNVTLMGAVGSSVAPVNLTVNSVTTPATGVTTLNGATLKGTLSITTGSIFLNTAAVTAGGAVTLTGDPIALNVPLTTPATVTLTDRGTVGVGENPAGGGNPGGSITTAGLALLDTGASGPFTLMGPNVVGTLAGLVHSSVAFNDTPALTVASVGATAGLNTNGHSITLTVAGLLTLGDGAATENLTAAGSSVDVIAAGVTQNAMSIISANTLRLQGTGAFSLPQNNLVNILAANVTGPLFFTNAQGLIIGQFAGTPGINTNGNNLTLNVTGTLALGDGTPTTENVTAAGALADITAAGVFESPNSIVTANAVRLRGTGSFALTQANQVGTLVANVTGPLSFTDARALFVTTVTGTDATTTNGITTNGNNLTLNDAGLLTLGDGSATAENVTAAGATVNITADGVTENTNSIITANALLLQGTGPFTLPGKNLVNVLSANVTGTMTFADNQSLLVGLVNGIQGITTGGNNLTLTVNGLLALGDGGVPENVLAAGAITDFTALGIFENNDSIVQASAMRLQGKGIFFLPTANAISTLAASIQGPVYFRDTLALTLGTVLGTSGIDTTAGNAANPPATVVLVAPGVTESAGNLVTASVLDLQGTGTFNLAQANKVGTISANVTGPLTFDNSQSLTVGQFVGFPSFAATAGVNSNGNNVTLNVAGGTLALGDGSGTAENLTASGAVADVSATQGGNPFAVFENANSVITASAARFQGNGNFFLPTANMVSTLAANLTGCLNFHDGLALTLGTVLGTSGITIPGGQASFTAPGVTESSGVIVTAAGLSLQGTGTFSLTQGNLVGALAAAIAGPLGFSNSQPLALSTVTCPAGFTTNGVTTGGNPLTLFVAGLLTLGDGTPTPENVLASGSIVDINAAGIVEVGNSTIQSADLVVQGTGTFTLPQGNKVSVLAATVNGPFDFTNAMTLTVGALTAHSLLTGVPSLIAGISTNGHNLALVTLPAGSTIALGDGTPLVENVTATGATVVLTTYGVFEDPNSIVTAGALSLLTTSSGAPVGSFMLTQANVVGTLAANVVGSINFANRQGLTVGRVAGTAGINTGGNNLTLGVNGPLALGDNQGPLELVTAAGATVDIVAAGVNENTQSVIMSNALRLQGMGTFNLTQGGEEGNKVAFIAANVMGPLAFGNAQTLTVGQVNGTQGITTGGNPLMLITTGPGSVVILGDAPEPVTASVVEINSSGGVIQNPNSTITAGALLLEGMGAFNLNQNNQVGTLAASVNGPISFVNAISLLIGAQVFSVAGVTANGNFNLIVGGNLVIAPLTVSPGSLVPNGVNTNGNFIFTVANNFTVLPILDASKNIVKPSIDVGNNVASGVFNQPKAFVTVLGQVRATGSIPNGPAGLTLTDGSAPGGTLFDVRPSEFATIFINGVCNPLPADFLKLELVDPNGNRVPFVNPTINGDSKIFTFPNSDRLPVVTECIAQIAQASFSVNTFQTSPTNFSVQTVTSVAGSSSGAGQFLIPSATVNPISVAPGLSSPTLAFSAPQVALGFFNNAAIPDLVVANGPGDNNPPIVTVINGATIFSGQQVGVGDVLAQFFAGDSTQRNGLFLAVGDLYGTGQNEIVTGENAGGNSTVRIFTPAPVPPGVPYGYPIYFQETGILQPYPGFSGGVRVAVGKLPINGTPTPVIVTAPGPGMAPVIKVFNPNGGILYGQFLAYDPSVTTGVFVAIGNFIPGANNTAGGPVSIATAAGTGQGVINFFDVSGTTFFLDPNFNNEPAFPSATANSGFSTSQNAVSSLSVGLPGTVNGQSTNANTLIVGSGPGVADSTDTLTFFFANGIPTFTFSTSILNANQDGVNVAGGFVTTG